VCVGTLVPASSLEALHQLLSHDSNKNKSQVVVSGAASSQDRLQDSLMTGSVSHRSSVPVSSSTVLPAQLTGSSTAQLPLDQRKDGWPTGAKHLSMPSLVEFL